MGGQRAARCLQAGTSAGPGAEDGGAGERGACKGSAAAELPLTVRGSSCRRCEPGSANPNTELADNKPRAPAALPSISGVRGACWRRAIPSSHPPRCQGGEGLVASLGGLGQPPRGPAGVGGWLCPHGGGAPGKSPHRLAGRLTGRLTASSHAHRTGRGRGETSDICCCRVSLGEVLVWRAIPALENYAWSSPELRREQPGRSSEVLSPYRALPEQRGSAAATAPSRGARRPFQVSLWGQEAEKRLVCTSIACWRPPGEAPRGSTGAQHPITPAATPKRARWGWLGSPLGAELPCFVRAAKLKEPPRLPFYLQLLS